MHAVLFDHYKDEYFVRLGPNTPDGLEGESPAEFLPTSMGAAHLQSLYISENPHPTGMKQMLDKADNSPGYSLRTIGMTPASRDNCIDAQVMQF